MTVKLVNITSDAEKTVAYLARVSSDFQDNPEFEKLFNYLIKHKHWSPFAMAHMTVEIEASRAIAAQILRHKSFDFQEFSQRYQQVKQKPALMVGRKQADKNRQSSVDNLEYHNQVYWEMLQNDLYSKAEECYTKALQIGVSREQARMLLPLATPTKLYMCGNLRSWIHYIELRTQPDTQKEHRDVAQAIKAIFIQQFPTLSNALGWSCTTTTDSPLSPGTSINKNTPKKKLTAKKNHGQKPLPVSSMKSPGTRQLPLKKKRPSKT